MGNEASAPDAEGSGGEGEGGGGGIPPLPPDQAAGGGATHGGAGDGRFVPSPPPPPPSDQQLRGQAPGALLSHLPPPPPPPQQQQQVTSALQARQQQLRNAAKRGVERTRTNFEKTRTMMRRGSNRQQQQQQQAQQQQNAGGGGEASENGGHARGQQPALHHQHSAPLDGRTPTQKVPHQQYHPHHHQQQQQYGVFGYPAGPLPAAPASSGGGRGGGPRRSPQTTAVVDVMYASEVIAHPNEAVGSGGAAGGTAAVGASGTAFGAAASQMADTAAAFAASLSSQMGQLSISASEAAGQFGFATSAGALAQPHQHQQEPAARQQQHQQQHQQQQGAHAHHFRGQQQPQQEQHLQQQQKQKQQPPGLESLGGSGALKTSGMSNDEDEWKNAWDEDEEESDDGGDDGTEEESDEEGDVLASLGGPLAVSGASATSGGKPPKGGGALLGAAGPAVGAHQPFRPAMDGGHSSSASSATSVAAAAAASASSSQWSHHLHPAAAAAAAGQQHPYAAPSPHGPPAPSQQAYQQQYQQHQSHQHQHQHQQANMSYYPASGRPSSPALQHAPPVVPVSAPPPVSASGYRGASPHQQLLSQSQSQSQPRAPIVTAAASPHETEEDVLKREADRVLSTGNGAVPWDTSVERQRAAAAAGVPPESMPPPQEKPCVQMFFPMLRVLGKGSFGKVVLVQKRTGKEKGGLFAMKILRKAHLVKRRQIERTKTERKVLSIVDHPFIMKLHYAFQTEDKLYLVLDYCPGGELFFHLSRFRRFPERVARFFAAELLLALGHLHKRGIIYRDLKPENVLLDADGHVKLGDFGLAKDKISHPCAGASSMCGTPEYMAPEVLTQQGHGFCVDYWGLGMLTFEMMTGLPPWYTTDRTKLFKRLRSAPLDIPSFFSRQSASFVSALLERDPRRRLGVHGVRSAMEHEFFHSIDWSSLRARRFEAPIRPCEGWRAPGNNRPSSGGSSPAVGGSAAAGGQNQISQNELDVATANFDAQFTRMAVDTEDAGRADEGDDGGDGGGEGEETLNENTFVGFTFDEMDPRGSRVAEHARPRGGPPLDPRSYRSRRK